MTAPLSTCTTTCVGLSGMNILGSYCQKILNPEGLFILISGGIRYIIYGMKQSCGGGGVGSSGDGGRRGRSGGGGVRGEGDGDGGDNDGRRVLEWQLPCLRSLGLWGSKSLKITPDFRDAKFGSKRIICKLKGLVNLYVWNCAKLESLPEEIGDLENLEELDAKDTIISRPPSSIVRLSKLKILTFEKEESEDGVFFVFPQGGWEYDETIKDASQEAGVKFSATKILASKLRAICKFLIDLESSFVTQIYAVKKCRLHFNSTQALVICLNDCSIFFQSCMVIVGTLQLTQ
ncbi:hypothetical protein MTR67_025678 [Solanum verrucosum]|uniref:Uncharacterized protein n=1 Tax=Solanum verrucosum TaxID=315347 RepID=A0AAF0R080_SOLVR|nr:hypothetical protein MTR67_025678 [Solanum verrucosum]